MMLLVDCLSSFQWCYFKCLIYESYFHGWIYAVMLKISWIEVIFLWVVLVLMHITVPLMFVALHLISFVAIQKYRIYYYCIKTNEICIQLFDLFFRVIVDLLEWNSGWRPQKLIIQLKVNFFFKRHYSYRKSFIVTFMCNKSAYIPFVRSTNYQPHINFLHLRRVFKCASVYLFAKISS